MSSSSTEKSLPRSSDPQLSVHARVGCDSCGVISTIVCLICADFVLICFMKKITAEMGYSSMFFSPVSFSAETSGFQLLYVYDCLYMACFPCYLDVSIIAIVI